MSKTRDLAICAAVKDGNNGAVMHTEIQKLLKGWENSLVSVIGPRAISKRANILA